MRHYLYRQPLEKTLEAVVGLSETELVKIARLEERVDNVEKTQDTILKRLDDKDSRMNAQLYTTIISLGLLVVNLLVLLAKG
jgi:hypothetical protein